MKKILLVDTIHPAFNEIVLRHGFEINDASMLSGDELIKIINDYDGIIIRSRFRIDKQFIDSASNLKFIARAGAGMENIDVAYATSKNIACISVPEGNRDAVGEHAIGMLLNLLNRISIADREVRTGEWKREANRGTELQGKTIGIIGFGNMGSAFAKRLLGFDVNIIAYDKYATINPSYSYVRQVEMETIFNEADVLSLHIPLTPETHYMVNAEFLGSFRKNIYLVNTSRGKNVKTADVVSCLISGKLKGACLDVNEYEEISFESLDAGQLPEVWKYLINCEKVILTPHIAGWSFESHRKISELIAGKILALYNLL